MGRVSSGGPARGVGRRARLLAGSGIALSAALAGQATAQSVVIDTEGGSVVSAGRALGTGAPQVNSGVVQGLQSDADIRVSGGGANSVLGVTLNSLTGAATGNSFAHTGASLLSTLNRDPDGVGASGVQFNNAAVVARSSGNRIAAEGFAAASATTVQANSIAATRTGNNAVTSVGGMAPVGYSASADGARIDVDMGGLGSVDMGSEVQLVADLGATVGLATMQFDVLDGSGAEAVGNRIEGVALASTGSLAVDGNSIDAAFRGNRSVSTLALSAETGSFDGSAAVLNVQTARTADGETTPGAFVAGSGVSGSAGGESRFGGDLAVSGNSLVASAAGNESLLNRIAIDEAMALSGAAGPAAVFTSDDEEASVEADLAMANLQRLAGEGEDARLAAAAEAADVTAVVGIGGGAAALTDNRVAALLTGNNFSGSIVNQSVDGAGGANVGASVAMLNRQSISGVALLAEVDDSIVAISTFVDEEQGVSAEGARFTLSGNRQQSNAVGSQSAQTVSLSANTLTGGGEELAVVGAGTDDGTVGDAGVLVASRQTAEGASVTARTTAADMAVRMGDAQLQGGAIAVEGNRQEAVALGAAAGNGLTLSATDFATTAAVVSSQHAGGSAVTAVTRGDISVSMPAESDPLDDGASAMIGGNVQRAVAAAGSATNDLSVTATTMMVRPVEVGALDPFAAGGAIALGGSLEGAPVYEEPQAGAMLALLNDQTSLGAVSATVGGPEGGAMLSATLGEDADSGSRAAIDGNAVLAAASGNQSTNGVTVNAQSITAGETFGEEEDAAAPAVAVVANVQQQSGAVTSRVLAGPVLTSPEASGEASPLMTIALDDLFDSSLSLSGNSVEALANGNQAFGNRLTLNGGMIDLRADDADVTRGLLKSGPHRALELDDIAAAQAGFAVQNVQASAGAIIASQRTAAEDLGEFTDLARGVHATLTVGDEADGSSILMEGNRFAATAQANGAVNAIAATATTLAASTGVNNVQRSASTMTAELGQAFVPGIEPTEDTPFDYSFSAGGLSAECVGAVCTVTGGTLTVAANSVTAAQRDALVAAGWTLQLSGALTRPATNAFVGTLSPTAYAALLEGAPRTATAIIPGDPGTPSTPRQGGVQLAIDEVTDSSVRIAGNEALGTAIANRATSDLTVDATTLIGSGARAEAGLRTDGGTGTTADHAANNVQQVTGGGMGADVVATFAMTGDAEVSDSRVDVSANVQRAEALGNLAATTVTVSATNLDASTALNNAQSSARAPASASSDMLVQASLDGERSSITLNDNRNTAVAGLNNATNRLSVSGTSIGGATDEAFAGPFRATADHALHSAQTASASVTAGATTAVGGTGADARIDGGSADMSRNLTTAQAIANQADNAASLSGTRQGASAALGNVQSSTATVAANAASAIGQTLTGIAGIVEEPMSGIPALNNGSLAIGGNVTAATARGNSAVNAMTVAGTGFATEGPTGQVRDGQATATFAVLNGQTNDGAVTATAAATTYRVALNGVATPSRNMVTSRASIADNSVSASAAGNTATSSLTFTALNAGTAPSAAVSNNQVNSGAIIATASNVTLGVAANGGALGGVLRAAGNSVSAAAVGNSAVASITGGR